MSGAPPVTRLRFEGAKAAFWLPTSSAAVSRYAKRLEEERIFPGQEDHLWRLSALDTAGVADEADEFLSKGQKDPRIWMLQSALNRLSELHQMPDLNCQDADGDFGEITEAAVRAYQIRRNLYIDGIAGPETLGALSAEVSDLGLSGFSLRRADLPRVAIMLSDPRKLIPGEDPELDHLIDLMISMGCTPVLIPPCADRAIADEDIDGPRALHAMVAHLDGILGPGGADVDPAIYGEENQFSRNTNFQRDRFEADFVRIGMLSNLYMFGICRSHQLWNAAAGGTLVQDVQAEGLSHISQSQADFQIDGASPFILRDADGNVRFENRVLLEPDSQIARILDGVESILTNSYHHQAVDVPGEGFRVTGKVWDEETKRHTIEVTERWNALTTQFHPEGMQRDPQERELLETLGRRALVFALLRRCESNVDELLARMGHFSANTFDPSEFDWVKTEIAPRLR